MNSTGNTYWHKRRAMRQQLEAQFAGRTDFFVTPLGVATPRAISVNLDNAARVLAEDTHRLSSSDEISEFKRANELARAQSRPVGSLADARALFVSLHQGAKDKAR